ncbi:MAG: hypothetical protein KDI73_01895 [Candidatus Competibacteraceae bacterium]|nr:hypothetical protein [Candidatus Competibacteraceae bacterium]
MITDSTAVSFNAWTSSRMGIQAGTNLMDQSAQTIAQQSVTATDSSGNPSSRASDGDLIGAMVQQGIGLYQVQASVKGLEIANKTLDSLFRITA